MTNWFYNYKWDDPEEQIRILKQCGYDSALLSLKVDPARWALLPGYLAGMKKYGVRLLGIHVGMDIDADTYPEVVKKHLPMLKDSKALLIPSVGSSKKADRNDPAAIARGARILRQMSDDCYKYGLGGVATYTHVGNWVETVDQGLRLAEAADRRNVGTMFHLFHFQATHSKDMEATLRRAKPYLMVVIIQGTDKEQATNKVLGEGTFDVVPLVRTLREIGYQGPLVTMGFSQRGDIPEKLLRGRQAWEKIKRDALQSRP
jgi:sugar phosphate isomerase/epimerase